MKSELSTSGFFLKLKRHAPRIEDCVPKYVMSKICRPCFDEIP